MRTFLTPTGIVVRKRWAITDPLSPRPPTLTGDSSAPRPNGHSLLVLHASTRSFRPTSENAQGGSASMRHHYNEPSECDPARQHRLNEVACCRPPTGTLVMVVLPTILFERGVGAPQQ